MDPVDQSSMEVQAGQMGLMPQRPRQMALPEPSEWALSCLAAKPQVGLLAIF